MIRSSVIRREMNAAQERANDSLSATLTMMNSETSQSEDAALRRLLREFGTVAPPVDFDARLRGRVRRARLKREQSRRLDPRSSFIAAFAPCCATVACGVLVLFFAVHVLQNPVTPDAVSSGADAPLLAPSMTYTAAVNDPGFAVETADIAEKRAQSSTRNRRNANGNLIARRTETPSAHSRNFAAVTKIRARVKQNSPYLDDDAGTNTEITSAAIPIYGQSVSVAPRALDRGAETLLLNPVSFGGEPLASLANNSATRRFAAMTQVDARERDTETQSAW